MIYDLDRGVLLLHIPRTGGMAIARAANSGPPTLHVCAGGPRHTRAAELQNVPPWSEHWQLLKRRIIVRNPWDRFRSWYAHVDSRVAGLDDPAILATMPPSWRRQLEVVRAEPGWPAFVRRLRPEHHAGGAYRFWACGAGGADLGVEPIRYEDLTQVWPNLAAVLGLPPETPLPAGVNHQPYPEDAVWTAGQIEQVGNCFADDVIRFGYEPPEVGA